MDAVASCVAPLRFQQPPQASRCYRRRCRGGGVLSSSVRSVPAAAASLSSSLQRPPMPSLLRRTRSLKARSSRGTTVVASAQFNVAKVILTAWKAAKDGVEAGTNLLPDSVPRPIARICVAGVAATVTFFLLKTVLSTALFVLAMMGLIYFTYIAFNAGEAPTAGGGTTAAATDEETLEEARRIMEKYK